MSAFKLNYFNLKARGEVIRLIFAQAGVSYEDNRMELGDKVLKTDEKLYPFGQLPTLEVDGKVLAQSLAIARYLASKFGLAGKDSWEIARCDMIVEGLREPSAKYILPILLEQDQLKRSNMIKAFVENELDNILKVFERLLAENNGGKQYFVGDDVTWTDLAFIHLVDTFQKFAPTAIEKFPLLNDLNKRVKDLPNIKQYLDSRPSTLF